MTRFWFYVISSRENFARFWLCAVKRHSCLATYRRASYYISRVAYLQYYHSEETVFDQRSNMVRCGQKRRGTFQTTTRRPKNHRAPAFRPAAFRLAAFRPAVFRLAAFRPAAFRPDAFRPAAFRPAESSRQGALHRPLRPRPPRVNNTRAMIHASYDTPEQ